MREKKLKTTSNLTGPSKPPLAQSVQNRMASTNGAWTPAFERFTSVCDGLWALHVWGGLRATHAPVVQPSAASATHPFGTGFGRPRPTPVRCGLRPLLTRVRRPSAAASSQLWCGHGRLSHTSMCKLDFKRNVPVVIVVEGSSTFVQLLHSQCVVLLQSAPSSASCADCSRIS